MKYIVFVVLCIAAGCRAPRMESLPGDPSDNKTAPANDQISFLTFTISKGENGIESVKLKSVQTVDGSWNERPDAGQDLQPGYLRFVFLDGQNNAVTTKDIENPLTRAVEYPEGNTFKQKQLDLDSADAFFRIRYHHSVNTIRVEKYSTPSTSVVLANLKL